VADQPRVLVPTARRAVLFGCVVAGGLGLAAAHAQLGLGNLLTGGNRGQSTSPNAPVTFQADNVEYDRDGALVIATGHVEAWQGDRVLRADKITFDRNTGVAAASGHVVLLEPDGEVLFSDYAELTQGMRNGVLRDMRAVLAENGKLAANGARRVEAQTNELSRLIYSTCNVCAQHPEKPTLWDIRARSAVQDLVNHRIEYKDAVIDLYGLPIAYFPYLNQPDPSQKRASGFLVPSFGQSTYLGEFLAIPYYLVIDEKSDATITPLFSVNAAPALELQYRLRLNEGLIRVSSSVAYQQQALQGNIFANGQFTWDDTWRYGFDLNRASTSTYLNDYKITSTAAASILTSQAYIEGFGQGAYTRLDVRAYQGLTTSISDSMLPFVLPRYTYSYVGEPDALGGVLSLDTGFFNVLRDRGTSTDRASAQINWERPVTGALGDLYSIVFHVDSAAYSAHGFELYPNYGKFATVESAQGMPTVAGNFRWPFEHDGDWGTEVVEPIAQLIAAPNGSSYNYFTTRIPDEDSFGLDFTDANLFSLNRFNGIDRLEGGMRANVALHANWTYNTNGSFDALVGQAYRLKKDDGIPLGSGLENTASDIVSHLAFTPSQYFDITTRERFDHRNLDLTFADALASAGPSYLRVAGGYLYSKVSPYAYLFSAPTVGQPILPGPPRHEVSASANTNFGPWKFSAYARRDLELSKMVGAGAMGQYEDECFIFNVRYDRRYTSIGTDHGATTVLFTITLKTVGQFGFHAS
jgi:LPS-assembly protein